MADTKKDRFYFVDPGIGEKQDYCPYSAFEDGHDVEEYITPPRGYEFSGFKLEPFDSPDPFYEGKLVAQFVKEEGFLEIGGPWKFIIAIALIGIIAGIIFFINRNNKQEVVIEHPATEVVSTVDDSNKAIPTETEAQEATAEPEAVVEQEAVTEEPVEEEIVQEEVIQEEVVQEEVIQEEVIQEEVIQEEVVKEEKVQTPAKEVVETEETPIPTAEMTAKFKKEFWNLIHRQTSKMYVYGRLYKTYKEQVEGEEYEYLIWTILRSNEDFEDWCDMLLSVPSDRISTVKDIDQLTKLLEEYY